MPIASEADRPSGAGRRVDTAPSSLTVSLVSIAVAVVVLALYISRYHWNPAVLVAMPAHWAECLGDVPPSIPMFHAAGNDGGYNYAASRDPFLTRSVPECAVYPLAYANERWLPHFASWAIAFGREAWLPYSMPILNLLSLGAVAFFAARCLERRGLSRWWALLCALNPGIWQPLRFNLVDPVFVACTVAAFDAYDRDRPIPTALWLTGAMLTRGIGIGVVIVLAGLTVLRRRRWAEAAFLLAAAVPYYAVLKPWLMSRMNFGLVPFGGADSLTWPFRLPIEQLVELLSQRQLTRSAILVSGVAFFVSATVLAAATAIRSWREGRLSYEPLIVIGYSIAAVSVGAAWGSGVVQMFRVVAFMFPCLLFLYAGDRRISPRLLIVATVFFSLAGMSWILLSPLMV